MKNTYMVSRYMVKFVNRICFVWMALKVLNNILGGFGSPVHMHFLNFIIRYDSLYLRDECYTCTNTTHVYRVNSWYQKQALLFAMAQLWSDYPLQTLLAGTAFHRFSFFSLYVLVSVLLFFCPCISLLSLLWDNEHRNLGKTSVRQKKRVH